MEDKKLDLMKPYTLFGSNNEMYFIQDGYKFSFNGKCLGKVEEKKDLKEEKELKCEICGIKFKAEKMLNLHISKIHKQK